MIFITGDTHRELDIEKLHKRHFPLQKEMTRSDYVIICGDFGAVWNNSKYDESTLSYHLSLIHISEPTRPGNTSRMPSSA